MLKISEGWRVERLEHRDAVGIIKRYHYANGASNTSSLAAGLIDPCGELVGAALWMVPMPAAANWAARVTGCERDKVINLSRLAIKDSVPRNAASFVLGRCRKMLRADGWQVALTYADRLQGHDGSVYLSDNWVYTGDTKPRARWTDPAGKMVSLKATRNISVREAKEMGWQRTKGAPKARFVLPLNRRFKRRTDALRLPYPDHLRNERC